MKMPVKIVCPTLPIGMNCFPVETVAIERLLPKNYNVITKDRQRAIVSQKQSSSSQVFAIQTKRYSLIPNSLI